MTRLDHLCFCKVCRNRQTNDFDIICGLTNKIADFQEKCDNFDLDSTEKAKVLEHYKSEIKENIEKLKSLLRKFTYTGPVLSFLTDKVSGPFIEPRDLNGITVNESKSKKIFYLILPFLLWGASANAFYKNGFNISGAGWIALYSGILIGLPIYFLYLFFRNKELFRMGKQGIIIEKKRFVPWFQINFIHFERIPERNNLVLRLTDGDDIKVEITEADMSTEEIGKRVYGHLKKYKLN